MNQKSFQHFKEWKWRFCMASIFFHAFILLTGCDGQVSRNGEILQAIEKETPTEPPTQEDETEVFCKTQRAQFHQEVWAPVLANKCQGCHSGSGIATLDAKSRFVLLPESYPNAAQINLDTIASFAKDKVQGTPYLLAKLSGEIPHNPPNAGVTLSGEELAQLKNFIEGLENAQHENPDAPAPNCQNVVARMDARLNAVPLLDANASFRKAAIHIAGRLPTPEERSQLKESPHKLNALIDALLEEAGFYERLKEVFNDMFVFYVRGQSTFVKGHFAWESEVVDGQSVYKASLDFPQIDALYDGGSIRNRKIGLSFLEEPLELIAYIAKNNRPFSEILTANYSVVNPFTAYGYGFGQEVPEPTVSMYEWSRVSEPLIQRKGLGRTGALAEAAVPRAGVLSTPAFLSRWGSTDKNASRGRAEFVSKNFLATSILTFAQRAVNTTDLDGTGNPTTELQACSVCHTYMDPLAATFTGFTYGRLASYQPQGATWNNPHYTASFAGKKAPDTLPNTQSMPWVAQQIVEDLRFPYAMVLRVFESVTGNKALEYPKDTKNPNYALLLSAWESQNAFLHEVASSMAAQGMNIRVAFREILLSPYFRAAQHSNLPADLATGLGEGRLLTPEILARKIRATLGAHWGIFRDLLPQRLEFLPMDYNVLYGGIHPTQSPERITQINTMMAATASAMAREMGCRIPAWEFSKPPHERIVLTKVQKDTLPFQKYQPSGPFETVPEVERAIRENLVYLHQRFFGETVEPNSPEVDIAYALFADVWKERASSNDKKINHAFCHGKWNLSKANEDLSKSGTGNNDGFVALPVEDTVTDDNSFNIYAWEAVLTYLLMDFRFIHE